MRQGQISIYYGMGKGKTAVAVGRGMRAIGEEQRVVMIQFLDYHNSKEIALLKKLEPDFRIFRFEKDRAAEDVQGAENDEALHKETSKEVAILKSANMSVGVNLLLDLVQRAAVILAESGFDIEIVEKHHNQKIDAPSGTAMALADAINQAMDERYHYVYDRSQVREKREKTEIGIHAVRGGNIVGEHDVIFAGRDEVIELTHRATSREVFAVGAVKAAKFLAGKPAGLYTMKEVLQ